jgi:DNA mismatch repair protein MutL
MGRIAVLPPALANQIAAGEVVERPASVVKELVENALDAGATRITIDVRAGGHDAIVVRDDGEGMSRDDAALAFARHATSKIRDADDLTAIASFGFRGEALPSIAAAAEVRLVTRRAADDAGTAVHVRGGVVVEVGDAGSAPGTQIEVRELFAAVPARRKFLKRPATEFGHIAEVISRLALAAPRVGFTLTHDGREVLGLPPVGAAADRLVQVLGRERAGDLVRFAVKTPELAVEAYLGRPAQATSSARLMLTYVGGRFVRDRVLTRAVIDGYDTLLMRGRYPVAVVFLDPAAGEVDVNVHPAKAEVRFRQPGRVHDVLARGIAARLRDALRHGGAEGEAAAHGRLGLAATEPLELRFDAVPGDRGPPRGMVPLRIGEPDAVYAALPLGGAAAAGVAASPAAPAVAARGRGFFASLRVLGQVLEGYLVCDSGRGVVIVDQHAAHERVTFEHLRAQLAAGGLPAQQLLVPETLELGARDADALDRAQATLARLGFEGEPFGDGIYLVRAVPGVLGREDVGGVLREVAAELAEVGASRRAEDVIGELLARVACHASVRVGRRLDRVEADALLVAMDGVDLAGYCPHGRPACVELDEGTLERLFKR